jgi:hypothetical protein
MASCALGAEVQRSGGVSAFTHLTSNHFFVLFLTLSTGPKVLEVPIPHPFGMNVRLHTLPLHYELFLSFFFLKVTFESIACGPMHCAAVSSGNWRRELSIAE